MNQQAQSPERKPTHRVYSVNGKGKAASWTPIGAAWKNRDGQGYSLSFEAIPLQGRIVMRAIVDKAEADYDA
jgi:hypothetical protein